MILLTRPKKDSEKLAELLGYECLIEPMIEIEKLENNLNNRIKNMPQAIVITSKNVSTQDVKKHNTIQIPQHGKNAKEILDYCLNKLSPDAGKVIYLSGDNITLPIDEELNKHGFDAERIVTYKTHAPKSLSENFTENFKKVTSAVFFSKQTYQNFISLTQSYEFSNIKAFFLSAEIAELANDHNWKEILICAEPNQNEMIKLLQTHHSA